MISTGPALVSEIPTTGTSWCITTCGKLLQTESGFQGNLLFLFSGHLKTSRSIQAHGSSDGEQQEMYGGRLHSVLRSKNFVLFSNIHQLNMFV